MHRAVADTKSQRSALSRTCGDGLNMQVWKGLVVNPFAPIEGPQHAPGDGKCDAFPFAFHTLTIV